MKTPLACCLGYVIVLIAYHQAHARTFNPGKTLIARCILYVKLTAQLRPDEFESNESYMVTRVFPYYVATCPNNSYRLLIGALLISVA